MYLASQYSARPCEPGLQPPHGPHEEMKVQDDHLHESPVCPWSQSHDLQG